MSSTTTTMKTGADKAITTTTKKTVTKDTTTTVTTITNSRTNKITTTTATIKPGQNLLFPGQKSFKGIQPGVQKVKVIKVVDAEPKQSSNVKQRAPAARSPVEKKKRTYQIRPDTKAAEAKRRQVRKDERENKKAEALLRRQQERHREEKMHACAAAMTVPEEPTPSKQAPVEATPIKAAPTEAAPAKTTPAKTAPVKKGSKRPAPARPARDFVRENEVFGRRWESSTPETDHGGSALLYRYAGIGRRGDEDGERLEEVLEKRKRSRDDADEGKKYPTPIESSPDASSPIREEEKERSAKKIKL